MKKHLEKKHLEKHLFKTISLLFFALCLAGALCACAKTDELPPQSSGDPITPEMRQEYFTMARVNDWFHLPEFSTADELPTEPIYYWFLLLSEGITGMDENGFDQVEWPWPCDDMLGLTIPVEDFDDFVKNHFGNVTLRHEIIEWGKNFSFDGHYYYLNGEGEPPQPYYELISLNIDNTTDKTVYTAKLNMFLFGYENFFYYNNELSLAENMADYAQTINNNPCASDNDNAVYSIYGKQIMLGEMTAAQAIEKMIIDGDTASFRPDSQLTVQFYINEET